MCVIGGEVWGDALPENFWNLSWDNSYTKTEARQHTSASVWVSTFLPIVLMAGTSFGFSIDCLKNGKYLKDGAHQEDSEETLSYCLQPSSVTSFNTWHLTCQCACYNKSNYFHEVIVCSNSHTTTHTHTHTHAHTHTCTHTHVHAHECTHTYTHMHAHN